MHSLRQTMMHALTAVLLVACSGSSNGTGDNSPEDGAATFTATVTLIEVDRTADQQDLAITGLPSEGATITLQQ